MQVALSSLYDPAFQLVLLAAFVTGIVRGFSGFGTGMLMAPIVASLYSPAAALVILVVMDSWPPAIPTYRARKQAKWGEIAPMLLGFVVALPLGVSFVKYGDPITLRWFISIVILLVVPVLWSGWQYRGPRNNPVSAAVGALCGFLGGSTQIPGPPAIIYWMASPLPATVIRASILVLFMATEFLSMTAYYLGGLFTLDLAVKGLLASPVFFLGILIGTRFFSSTSETVYRRIAFGMILISAIGSLPLLDTVIR